LYIISFISTVIAVKNKLAFSLCNALCMLKGKSTNESMQRLPRAGSRGFLTRCCKRRL